MVFKSKPLIIQLLLVVIFTLFSNGSNAYSFDEKQGVRTIKPSTKVSFLGRNTGLAQLTVSTITQDHDGFIWLGTSSGIIRFDGSQFKGFESKSSGLSSSTINSLLVDSKGRLWVGTAQGINQYLDASESFTHKMSQGLLDPQILSIYEDSTQKIWVSTASGIHFFDDKNNRFKPLSFTVDGYQVSPQSIKSIYEYDNRFIWFGSETDENYVLDKSDNQLYPLSAPNPLSISLKNIAINDMLSIDNNRLLIISERQIMQYINGQMTTVLVLDSTDMSRMRRAALDDEGDLWISSDLGLKRYSLRGDKLVEMANVLDIDSVFSVFNDNNGTVWFGTRSNGLGHHIKSNNLFKHLSTRHHNLSDDVVWGINEDSKKGVWVSGQSNILNRLDMDAGTITDFDTKLIGDKAIGFNRDSLFVGGAFGLYQYDIKADDFTGSKTLISDKDVAYLTTIDQHLYFGAWADGLYRVKVGEVEANNELESILFEDKKLPYITTLHSYQNKLYVGQLSGLLLVDVELGLSRSIPEFSDLRVGFIHIDESGVFISTGSNGVYHFNHDLTKMIKHYDNQELLNRTIYSALKGAQDNLWLSTDKGILQIGSDNSIRNFDMSDGLQALDFNGNSALLNSDGILFFGGMNGLNYFDSHHDANQVLASPKLVFTDFTVFNKPVGIGIRKNGISTINQSISTTPDITLNYTDYPFELTFNLVNSPQPQKIYYQYMVEGVDNDWITSKATQTATYTNLNFGHYTLKVRAFHNNVLLPVATNQIAIEVLPPIWLSYNAIALYAVIFLILCFGVSRMLTQRKLTAIALKEGAERLELSLWGSGDMMWDWDIKLQKMHLTKDWEQFDYLGLMDQTFSKIHPNDREMVQQKLRAHLAGEIDYFEANYRIRRHDKSQQWVWIVDRAKVKRSESGESLRLTGTIRDITTLKDAELKLNLQANVMANISDAIYVLNLDFNVVEINAAFTQITGLLPAQVLDNKRIFNTYHGGVSDHIQKRLSQGADWTGEVIATKPGGSQYNIELSINPMRDSDGDISHYVAAFSDITQRKDTEQELRNLSNIDPLTNLPNRSYFQYAHRNLIRRKEPHALLTMDLDNFKKVNDSMGHETGDKLLCMIAERIESNVDCQHLLCRLGGDEFALLLEDIDDISMITQVLSDIEVSMQDPFYLGEQVFAMSSSVGVAIYPHDGESTENMLQSSDTAMYHAKAESGFSYQFFSSSMNDSAVRRLQIESLIRQALKNDWFEVYYQPKIDVKTRLISGMEALVRLIHPDQGMISPNEFIPIAEDTGLVIAIGEKVLDKACYATQQWRKNGLFNGRVAVNLAAKQFTQSNLLERVDHILECTQLPIANLEFEITEGTVIEDPETAIKTMNQLTDRGIHLALDDFGTGYSSLSYLKRFPIHTLKIDKAFIDDLTSEQDERHMVASIISLAHNMGLNVVAEGVESEGQVNLLEDLDCEVIQGYYFSRPLSEADFTSFLMQQKQQSSSLLEG